MLRYLTANGVVRQDCGITGLALNIKMFLHKISAMDLITFAVFRLKVAFVWSCRS